MQIINLPESLTTVTTFSKIIAIIIFFLLLIGAFYSGFMFQYKNKQNNLDTNLTKEKNTVPHEKWIWYKNAKYGFSFMFPLALQGALSEHDWGVIAECRCPGFKWFDVEVVETSLTPQEWWQKNGNAVFNGKVAKNGKYHPLAYKTRTYYEINSEGNKIMIVEGSGKPILTPPTGPGSTAIPLNEYFKLYFFPKGIDLFIINVDGSAEPGWTEYVLATFSTSKDYPPSWRGLSTD